MEKFETFELGQLKHFLPEYMCTQRSLRSAYASAQSDQNLRCLPEGALAPWLPKKCPAKTDQTARMRSLIRVVAGRTCNPVGNAVFGSNSIYRKTPAAIVI